MDKKLNKGNNSNYEIILTITPEEQAEFKKIMLKRFGADMKVQGFRQGHVPLHIVEQNIQPQYIQVGIYEEAINAGLKDLLEDEKNKEIKFMGEPYDINNEEKDGNIVLTLKLDVYPDVEVKDDKWSKEKLGEIKTEVDEKEVEEALLNLKKNYADYQDTDAITEDTVSKVAMHYLDKDGNEKDKGTTYVGEPEFAEFDFFKKTFIGKKRDEEFEIPYKAKDVPPTVKYNKGDDKDIKTIKFHISDVKKIVLPEMDEETIKKLFGGESEVKNEKELKAFIKDNLEQNKKDSELVKAIEEYINAVRSKSFSVQVPQTLIAEEQKTRLQSLEQRFGSKEKVEQYFNQLGAEKSKAFIEDIKKSAAESLEKFFILQKVVELLELKVDRQSQEQLHVEKMLYEKLTGKKYE